MAEDHFSIVDYVVFSIMLLISALIGIWYGCGPGGNKQRTTAEYLLGDRQMKNWPVAISIQCRSSQRSLSLDYQQRSTPMEHSST